MFCVKGHENLGGDYQNCRVLKDLQDWKELPVDCLALSLYNLQIFYLNEMKRGLAGTGTYHLTESFLFLKSTHYSAGCVSVDSPEDIVKFIRAKGDTGILERDAELSKQQSCETGGPITQLCSDNGKNRNR